MLKKTNKYILIALVLALLSCNNSNDKNNQNKKLNFKKYKKHLLEANKHLVKTESQEIEDYIKRYNWDMKQTKTGLRYMIYKHGKGVKAEEGKTAKINYTVELINGALCYSSEKDGPKEFVIGKRNVEAGLEQGVSLMRVGDRAKLIIPSYLAFGLIGDQNRIPKKATLIYDINLLEIKKIN